MSPRVDNHRFTRVTMWIERHDTRAVMDAIADDLAPSVRLVQVRHDQALPTDGENHQ